jgi:putative membrane protein
VAGSSGGGAGRLLPALAPVVVVLAASAVRWATARYRVGPERVELRGGLVRRTERSVRRDRVRTVDLHATLAHRWCGLTAVDIGTGTADARSGRLRLDGVTPAEAQRLRTLLLDRTAPAPTAAAEPPPAAPEAGTEVARLHPVWLRYAPLTASGLVALGALAGAAAKIAGDAGVNLFDDDALHAAGERITDSGLLASPVVAVSLLAAAVLAVASVGAVAVYAESWWHYRLLRGADGTLRLHRGLLTTRALSIEQRRMRGVSVTEPLLLRLAGAARVSAVTTGLDARSSSRGTLLPPAPAAEAHRVAAAALLVEHPQEATASTLVRHPPVALRRRMVRAVAPAVLLTVAAWWLSRAVGGLGALWPGALLLTPLAALLAADRYRNLGHTLRSGCLVISRGGLVRRRVALYRTGIIAWRLRQSPAQRWAGVVTLDAVTPGGCFPIVDIAPDRARQLVDAVSPGLLPAPGPAPARAV